mmetsp:Transcript_35896/g.65703  ORF Transcript_35896/g.65703 Transcript_35896/m.65703 type:complete len:229 (-) Transcript_35896:513-1199(-)
MCCRSSSPASSMPWLARSRAAFRDSAPDETCSWNFSCFLASPSFERGDELVRLLPARPLTSPFFTSSNMCMNSSRSTVPFLSTSASTNAMSRSLSEGSVFCPDCLQSCLTRETNARLLRSVVAYRAHTLANDSLIMRISSSESSPLSPPTPEELLLKVEPMELMGEQMELMELTRPRGTGRGLRVLDNAGDESMDTGVVSGEDSAQSLLISLEAPRAREDVGAGPPSM